MEAGARIQDFVPLVQTNCSHLLKFFLCSLYAPMCTEHVRETLTIPACRSVCLQVKLKCEPLLQTFNFEWPEMLSCDKLPEKSDPRSNLCLSAPNSREKPDVRLRTVTRPRVEDLKTDLEKLNTNVDWKTIITEKWNKKDQHATPQTNSSLPILRNVCPSRFVYIDNIANSNNTCALRCDVDVAFRKEDKDFAGVWMLLWSSLCCVSSIITVATFVVDIPRFKYPEKAIIFLSVCYLMQSVAYIIRAVAGPESVSCDTARDGRPFLILKGLENVWCVIIFVLRYFFGMATSIWWVVLTITWYLAADRKWNQESLETLSNYFHMAAWTIPAIKTSVILTMGRVDGDELTGLCYVGNQDPSALTSFVIIPLIFYLITGLAFILCGFVAMLRIKKDLKQDTNRREYHRLKKLMSKIGVFTVLYTVPALCVICCHIYERVNYSRWRALAMDTPCPVTSPSATSNPKEECQLDHSIPSVEIYMLKLFMSLVVGITSGMWLSSEKTLTSWIGFLSRRFYRRNSNIYNSDYHPTPAIILQSRQSKFSRNPVDCHNNKVNTSRV